MVLGPGAESGDLTSINGAITLELCALNVRAVKTTGTVELAAGAEKYPPLTGMQTLYTGPDGHIGAQ